MTKIGESPLFLEQMQKWSISDSTKSYPFSLVVASFFFFFPRKKISESFKKKTITQYSIIKLEVQLESIKGSSEELLHTFSRISNPQRNQKYNFAKINDWETLNK